MRSSENRKLMSLPSRVSRHASFFVNLNEEVRRRRQWRFRFGVVCPLTQQIGNKLKGFLGREEDGFISNLSIRGFGSCGSNKG